MHARISTLQVKPGKLEESIQYFKEAIMRLQQEKIKGYQQGWLFVNRQTLDAVVVTLWESEADSTAYANSSFRQEVLSRFSDIFVGEPMVGVFEAVA